MDAAALAERGMEFSPMENTLHLFYGLLELRKQIKAGKDVGDLDVVEHQLRDLARDISGFVIDAIIDKKPNKIEQVAEAVDLLKRFKPVTNKHKQQILFHTYILKKQGEAWDIHQWAKELKYRNAADRENGYPHLRRQLKELNAPLKAVSQIEKPSRSKNLG
jgi:hypothetical protein